MDADWLVFRDWLIENGWERIEVEYNGEGDSGQIGGILVIRGETHSDPDKLDFKISRPTDYFRKLSDLIDSAACKALERVDWYNNDGGYGRIHMYPGENKVEVNHNYRITASEAEPDLDVPFGEIGGPEIQVIEGYLERGGKTETQVITMEYNGYGDSGSVYTYERTLDNPIEEAARHVVYNLIEENEPGWEINEGSRGSVMFMWPEKIARIRHENNIESSERESWEVKWDTLAETMGED